MKAFSVRSPWWVAILHLGKDIENRGQRWHYRGRIFLHASSWWSGVEILSDIEAIGEVMKITGKPFNGIRLDYLKQAGGCIVGSVEIVDCVEESDSPWFFGNYGLVLRNPVTFENPVPCKGALGPFDVPAEVERLCHV